MRASVLLIEDGVRVRHGAAPSLPEEWTTWIDGYGPSARTKCSCGTAAFRKQAVIATDIATDARWVKYRDTALRFGLRAGWSIPFFDGDGNVLGTFAMYYDRPRAPSVTQLGLAEHAGHLASVAVQRHRQQAAIVESEETARLIIDQALDANVAMDASGLVRAWNARATAMFGWTSPKRPSRPPPVLSSIIPPSAPPRASDGAQAAHRDGPRHHRRAAGGNAGPAPGRT